MHAKHIERKVDLEARMADLKSKLATIEHDLDAPVSADSEDRAVEREGDEVMERLGLAAQNEVRAIEAALARLAHDAYGRCEKCDVEISEERLNILPYTTVCRICAQAA